jgi:hypothetical protein
VVPNSWWHAVQNEKFSRRPSPGSLDYARDDRLELKPVEPAPHESSPRSGRQLSTRNKTKKASRHREAFEG